MKGRQKLQTVKKFKTLIFSISSLLGAVLGVFLFFDYITADFVRVGQAASAQDTTDRKIQVVQSQSIENKADLLYIHKRGTRRELKQAEEELRMLEDFDDVNDEREKLTDEIADLETEMEEYDRELQALKSPP